MSVASAAVFEERIDPGKLSSAVLAAAVHFALLAILVFGVRWQNRPAESVTVELWEPPPAPAVEAPKPEPVPPPVAAPEPKPEPVIPKPDIAEKAPPPKPKPVPKVEPPKPKAVVAPAPKVAARPRDEAAQRQIRDQLAREQASLERQHIKDQLARDSAAMQKRDYDVYAGRIKAKIRGNIVLPPDLKGNPEAIFDVVQLPTGEVLTVKLRKSSGHAGYDLAVERAVLKSSPLPRPDRPELFQRALELKFRPLD